MNKELLISIKPEHLLNILNGKKTLELRKTVPKDYKGWVNIYCTKTSLYELIHHKRGDFDFLGLYDLYDEKEYYSLFDKRIQFDRFGEILNGKVVARFWFDEYETYDFDNHGVHLYTDVEEYNVMYDDLERLCLDYREIENYGKGKTLYAWHIKDLEIFGEPKELSEFYKGNRYPNGEIITPNICEFSPFDYDSDLENCLDSFRINKPPQNYQFVYVKE